MIKNFFLKESLFLPIVFLSFQLGAQELTDGLLTSYTFDNDHDAVIVDSKGRCNGTLAGTVIHDKGAKSNYVYFDGGPDSRIVIPKTALADNIEEMSLSFWMKVSNYPRPGSRKNYATVISFNWLVEFRILHWGVGQIRLQNRKDKLALMTPSAFNTGDWYHVVCTYSVPLKQFKLYINGILAASQEEGIAPISGSRMQPLLIGGSPKQWNSYDGAVDNLRIYGTVLNEKEVEQLFALDKNEKHPVFYKRKTLLLSDFYKNIDPGKPFQEISYFPSPDWNPPTPIKAEKDAGMIPFMTMDPGEYLPDRVPRPEEHVTELQCFLTPGEYEPLTFGVYGLEPLTDFELIVEGSNLPLSIDKRYIHCWPQRTDWKSRWWYMAPELLLPFADGEKTVPFEKGILGKAPFVLGQNETTAFWLTLHADENTVPGKYSSLIKLRSKNKASLQIPLEIDVLPFKLANPPDKYWSLYADTKRWSKMSDVQVLRELQDFSRHGINSLIEVMTLQKRKNGEVAYDINSFMRIAKLCNKTGISGPLISTSNNYIPESMASILSLNCDLKKEWTEELKRAVTNLISTTNTSVKKEGLNWYFYGKDEPREDDTAAVQIYLCAKEAGVKTCGTVTNTGIYSKLAGILTLPILGYDEMLAEQQQADEMFETCKKNNSTYWYYATGCYRGQESCMFLNRYGTGVFMLKSGASGSVSWTFCRPKEDAFNDFDGSRENPREPKDACIAYPHLLKADDWSTYQGAIPTLAWESIREGIDDYKYFQTLNAFIDESLKSKDVKVRDMASKFRKDFNVLVDALPRSWRGMSARDRWSITGHIQALRKIAADMTVCLLKARNDETVNAPDTSRLLAALKNIIIEKPAQFRAAAKYTSIPLVIDGRLDENAWKATGQLELRSCLDMRESFYTTAKILWDKEFIYIGFYCEEPFMKNLVAQKNGLDSMGIWEDDCVEIFIAPYDSKGEHTHIVVNTNEALYDAVGPKNISWNSGTTVRVFKGKDYWSVEMAIPWKNLKSAGIAESPHLRMNLCRSKYTPDVPDAISQSWSKTYGSFHASKYFGTVKLVK